MGIIDEIAEKQKKEGSKGQRCSVCRTPLTEYEQECCESVTEKLCFHCYVERNT